MSKPPMTTREKLTPEAVGAMSDEELSRMLRGVIPMPILLALDFRPSSPVAVDHVREHMRQWWRETAPDPVHELDWYICGWGGYYCVGQHHCGGSGAEFPLHNAALVKRERLGRAVFESALLARLIEPLPAPVSQATPDNERERAG